MNDKERIIERLEAISERWNHVETRLKLAEQLSERVVVPAINELRYAGRRIGDALLAYLKADHSQNKPDLTKYLYKASEDLLVAEKYLENADHDIVDAVISHVHAELLTMINQYSLQQIVDKFPEFSQFYKIILDSQAKVLISRNDRSKRSRLYGELSLKYVPELLIWRSKFIESIIDKRLEKRESAITDIFFYCLLLLLGVSILSILFLFYALAVG